MGGVLNRSEFFTVGPALTNALSSEEHATAGGQIIVSETAFKFVKNMTYFICYNPSKPIGCTYYHWLPSKQANQLLKPHNEMFVSLLAKIRFDKQNTYTVKMFRLILTYNSKM